MASLAKWMLPIVLLLFVGTPTYSAEPDDGQEASEDAAPKPDAQIANWISQLDSDEFKVREQATQGLTKAGLKALPAVLKATNSKRVEVRSRAFEILFALSTSNDQATANAVQTALEKILQSQDRLRVARAKKILEHSRNRAIQILLKLGARFNEPDSIYLSGSRITDEHMVHLKWLPNLHYLSLYYTQVTGAGLEHLKWLTKLETLNLDNSKVTDAGLVHLKGLTNLIDLNLAGTKVTDAGLEHLKWLTNLRTLRLDKTSVTDAGLEHLKGLTELRQLYLFDTKVTDAGLEHLKGLTKLTRLRLNDTQVTDAGLEHLKGMTNLQKLGLRKTKVTDAGLEHLKGLTKLKRLGLDDTKVTDEGVKKLQQALPNCEIRH